MPEEITDEIVKKKHKEFDDRIKKFLAELRGKSTNGQPDIVTRIKEAARFFRGRSS